MTNIRASGFHSKSDLQEHLDELDVDELPETGTFMRQQDERASQLELSWLRREVSILKERLQIASGTASLADRRHAMARRLFPAAVVPVAGFIFALLLVARKRDPVA